MCVCFVLGTMIVLVRNSWSLSPVDYIYAISLKCSLDAPFMRPCATSKQRHWKLHVYIYIYIYIKLATVVEGDPKVPFSIATILRCRVGRNSLSRIAPFYS